MLSGVLKRKFFAANVKNALATVNYSQTESSAPKAKTTVIQSEIEHFQKLHENWWDPNGNMKLLHSMNTLRVPFVRDGLINTGVAKQEHINTATPLVSTKILDIGCAGGILTEALGRLGAEMTGIDATPELIDKARSHYDSLNNKPAGSINYLCSTIEEHAAESNVEKYDAVVASEVLEHVNEKELFLELCVKCIKPGGSVFITTINKTTLAWFGAIVMGEYVFRLLPKDTHAYDMFIEPHRVQKILEDNKCYTRLWHGMMCNVLTNRWSWTSVTDINYALHAVKH